MDNVVVARDSSVVMQQKGANNNHVGHYNKSGGDVDDGTEHGCQTRFILRNYWCRTGGEVEPTTREIP